MLEKKIILVLFIFYSLEIKIKQRYSENLKKLKGFKIWLT